MPVTAADLTYPEGEIRTEWFSGEDLPANLAFWISEGEAAAPAGSTTAEIDAIARPWAYYRAYDAKTMQMAGSPDSVNLDGLARTQVKGRDFFAAKARAWKTEYEAALAVAGGSTEPGGGVEVSLPLASSSVPFVVVY